METQWFLVYHRCPLAPKSKMHHILECMWAYFQRTKMILSHTFPVNKMGKIKVSLQHCQIHQPHEWSLSKYPPSASWWATLLVTFCPCLWEKEESSKFLSLLEDRWKPISLSFYSLGVYLAWGRTGSNGLITSLQAMSLHISTLNWTRTNISCFEHLHNPIDKWVILPAWSSTIRNAKQAS